MLSLAGASLWWALEVLARYAQRFVAPAPDLPPLFAHSGLMLYAFFPCFMAGFLYTAAPRWLDVPGIAAPVHLATAGLILTGSLLFIAGLYDGLPLLVGAVLVLALGWLLLWATVLRMLVAAPRLVSHAVAISIALGVGCAGVAIFGIGIPRRDGMMLHLAVRVGLWGTLVPVFYTVCHRMLPFFAHSVIADYRVVRPLSLLIAVLALCYLRLAAGVLGWLEALLVLDARLLLVTLIGGLAWQPWKVRSPALLGTLFVAYFWLPIAMLLQTLRDLGFVLTGEWWLGRAAIHALGIGFMTSLLIAMVTRVTLGHSGRSLVMSRAVLGCFLLVQGSAVTRVAAEIIGPGAYYPATLTLSLALWLTGVITWTILMKPTYLRPRVDGRPG
jgi:uncharacterized protein involved in response to NO